MDTLMALAVSIGVLIGLWVKFGGLLAPGLAIAVPTGIVAWACFFAAGGKVQGLQKAIAANLSGGIWVGIAMTLSGAAVANRRRMGESPSTPGNQYVGRPALRAAAWSSGPPVFCESVANERRSAGDAGGDDPSRVRRLNHRNRARDTLERVLRLALRQEGLRGSHSSERSSSICNGGRARPDASPRRSTYRVWTSAS